MSLKQPLNDTKTTSKYKRSQAGSSRGPRAAQRKNVGQREARELHAPKVLRKNGGKREGNSIRRTGQPD